MTDNKNNSLNQEEIEKHRRPRRRRSSKSNHDLDTRTLSERIEDAKRKDKESHKSDNFLENLMDMVGASSIAFVVNGEKGGKNAVSSEDFRDVIKDMLTNTNNVPQDGPDFDVEDMDESELDEDGEEYYEKDLNGLLSELLGEDEEGEEVCPVEALFKVMMQTRPFGIDWETEKVIKFLEENGYTILKKRNNDGTEYPVAVKKGVTKSVENIRVNNLSREFSSVVQDKLLSWLSSIK